MKREELLMRLAMELSEWPTLLSELSFPMCTGWQTLMDEGHSRPLEVAVWSAAGGKITKAEWLAERDRLIAKPSWKDAPAWAMWLAQEARDGRWVWFGRRPEPIDAPQVWDVSCQIAFATQGTIPAGHDWRQTLEERPGEPLITCPAPRDLVTDQLIKRCDELEEDKAALADENQRLRRALADLAG